MKNITLLSLVAAALLFTACGEKTKEAATDAANAVTEAVKEDTSSVVDAAKKAASDATDAATAKAAEMATAAKAEADKLAAAASEKAADAAAALKERAAAATAAVSATPTAPAAYAKCKGCHGADGRTKALGKSAVISGQSKEAIITSMNEYKAGTKNVSGMGMLMKGQVASMSDADIEAVADYLSQL